MAQKYQIRPGIVSVTVCGENILVATWEARGKCPYTAHFNEVSAYLFSLIEQGLDQEQMIAAAAGHYALDSNIMCPKVVNYINELIKYGYLIPEDET